MLLSANLFQTIVAGLALLSLMILLLSSLSNQLESLLKPAEVIHLIASTLILNEILFAFSFLQVIHFVVAIILALPIPFILYNLGLSKNILKYWTWIGGLILIFTILFFDLIYVPYEDYWNGIPIIFIHYWIRNWLVFISITLIAIGLARKTSANTG